MRPHSLYSMPGSLAALLALIAAVYLRIDWIASQEFPPSTDAFFYLQEMKYRLSGQGSYYHEAPLFFSLFEQLARFFSLDEQRCYQLMVVSALGALLIAGLLSGGRRPELAAISALPVVFFDTSFYRIYAFPRQALSCGVFFIVLLLWNRTTSSARRACLLFIGLIAITIHWYALFLAALAFTAWIFLSSYSLIVKIAAGLFPLLLLVAVLANASFPILNLPVTYLTPGWAAACDYAKCSPRELSEFGVITLLTLGTVIAASARFFRTASLQAVAAVFILLVSNLPLWNLESHLGYRLALGSVWAFPLLLGAILIRVEARQPLIMGCLLFIGFISLTSRKDYVHEDDLVFELSSHADLLRQWIPASAFIQAPHGAQFRVTYFLSRNSAPKLPDSDRFSAIYTLSRVTKSSASRRCSNLSHAALELIPQDTPCVLLGETWVLSRPPRRNFN